MVEVRIDGLRLWGSDSGDGRWRVWGRVRLGLGAIIMVERRLVSIVAAFGVYWAQGSRGGGWWGLVVNVLRYALAV